MKRKFGRIGSSGSLLAVLVAGVVTVSIAVMPAAAQAEPHIYKNGTLVPEGEKVPFISWGRVQYEATTFGLIECRHLFSGNLQNPVGGGSGEGELEGLSAYNCSSIPCENAGKTIEVFPVGLDNPLVSSWELHLLEQPVGTFKLRMGNKNAESKKKIALKIVCKGQFEPEAHGELSPNMKNGTSIGAAPSKVEFLGASSGELESSVNIVAKGKTKLMGYEGQDLIAVKNP